MDNFKKGMVTSSMIDLKAELFRKQEEFKQQKASGSTFVKGAKTEQAPKDRLWTKQNAGVLARAQKDQDDTSRDEELEDLHTKSVRALEEKAKLYNQLCNSSTLPDEDGSGLYLVDFQKKVIDSIVEERDKKRKHAEMEEEETIDQEPVPDPADPEEEWIDFTDSLGRSRRCMKKDLSQLLEQDRDSALKQARKKMEPRPAEDKNPLPSLMSSDMHREMMRQKWEDEMRELQEKGQKDIHYANVQFDEIRSHGVGFFQFSKDHEMREEQLDSLRKLRKETVEEHSHKDRIKEKRKAMMEARLAKVRQRRNIKEVPSATDVTVPKDDDTEDDTVGPKLAEAVLPVPSEDVAKGEEMQKLAEEKRKSHVREWDKHKQVTGHMGRQNFIEALRGEREPEFAPPAAYFEESKPINKTHMSNTRKPQHQRKSLSCGVSQTWNENTSDQETTPVKPESNSVTEQSQTTTQAVQGHKLCSNHSEAVTQGRPKKESESHQSETATEVRTAGDNCNNPNTYQTFNSSWPPPQGQYPHRGGNSYINAETAAQGYKSYQQNYSYTHGHPMSTHPAQQNSQNSLTDQFYYGQPPAAQQNSLTDQFYYGHPPPAQQNSPTDQFYYGHPPQAQQNSPTDQFYYGQLAPAQQNSTFPFQTHQQIQDPFYNNVYYFDNEDATSATMKSTQSDTTSSTLMQTASDSTLLRTPSDSAHLPTLSTPLVTSFTANDEVSKPKNPRFSIIDTRFVRNQEAVSGCAPERETQVAAVPYTPGSFTAAKEGMVRQNEETAADSRLKSQISGTAVLYTAEQLKRQQEEQQQEQLELLLNETKS